VNQFSSLADDREPADRVRALGIDPGLLSPDEQVEIIAIHRACPDESLDGERENDI